jgi:CarD family transcriptional regulator
MTKKTSASKKAPAKAPKKIVKREVKKAPKNIAKKEVKKVVKKLEKKVVKAKIVKVKKIVKKEIKKQIAEITPKKVEPKKVEVKKEIVQKKIVKKETVKKESPKREKDLRVGGFKAGDHAFYPSHGVGKIIEIEIIEIAGQNLSFLIMFFEKERLTIKVPSNQIIKTGLRALISKSEMEEVFNILKSGVKKMKGMWSRRAQEYEAKINSGNITLLAEVLRDLTRDIEDGDRSYSERIIYETAINRLSLEYSVIEGVPFEEAKEKIISTAKHKLGLAEEVKELKNNFDDDFDTEDESEEEEEEDDDDDDDDKPKRGRKKK